MTVLGSRDGSAEPDVLSSFLPPWKARRDSASELNGDDAPLDCLDTAAAYDEEPVPEEGRAYEHTLRQLRHLATSLGVQRVPKSAYTTDRVLQTGGFGKVSLVHVEGVDQRLALKTVRLSRSVTFSSRRLGDIVHFCCLALRISGGSSLDGTACSCRHVSRSPVAQCALVRHRN
jgi:hypothetical protein